VALIPCQSSKFLCTSVWIFGLLKAFYTSLVARPIQSNTISDSRNYSAILQLMHKGYSYTSIHCCICYWQFAVL